MSDQKLTKLLVLYEQENKIEREAGKRKAAIWAQIESLIEDDIEYIRPETAGKILGVTGQAVINWIRAGVFEPGEYKKISSHTYVIDKRVIQKADFFERSNPKGRARGNTTNNNYEDIKSRIRAHYSENYGGSSPIDN